VFFSHEVNEKLFYSTAWTNLFQLAEFECRKPLVQPSWGKLRNPIRVAVGTLVTESAHR
jgi:hypothetical protein